MKKLQSKPYTLSFGLLDGLLWFFQGLLYIICAIAIFIIFIFILAYQNPTFYVIKTLNLFLNPYKIAVSAEKVEISNYNRLNFTKIKIFIPIEQKFTTNQLQSLIGNQATEIQNIKNQNYHYFEAENLDLVYIFTSNFLYQDFIMHGFEVLNKITIDYGIEIKNLYTNILPYDHLNGFIYLEQSHLTNFAGYLNLFNSKNQEIKFEQNIYENKDLNFISGKLEIENLNTNDISNFDTSNIASEVNNITNDAIANKQFQIDEKPQNKINNNEQLSNKISNSKELSTKNNEMPKFNSQNHLFEQIYIYFHSNEKIYADYDFILNKNILKVDLASKIKSNSENKVVTSKEISTNSSKNTLAQKNIEISNNKLEAKSKINKFKWKNYIFGQNLNFDIYQKINFSNFDFDKSTLEYLKDNVLDGQIEYIDSIFSNYPIELSIKSIDKSSTSSKSTTKTHKSFFDDMDFFMLGSGVANDIKFKYSDHYPLIKKSSILFYFDNESSNYYVKSTETFDGEIQGLVKYNWLDNATSNIQINFFGKGFVDICFDFIPNATKLDLKKIKLDLEKIKGHLYFKSAIVVPMNIVSPDKPMEDLKIDILAKLFNLDWKMSDLLQFNADFGYVDMKNNQLNIFTAGLFNNLPATIIFKNNISTNTILSNFFVDLNKELLNSVNIGQFAENVHLHSIFSLKNNKKTISFVADITNNELIVHNILHKKFQSPGFLMAFGKIDNGLNLNVKMLSEDINSTEVNRLGKNISNHLVDNILYDSQICDILNTKSNNSEVSKDKINFTGNFNLKDFQNYDLNCKLFVGKIKTNLKLKETPEKTKLDFVADIFDLTKLNLDNLFRNSVKENKDKEFNIFIRNLAMQEQMHLSDFLLQIDLKKNGFIQGDIKAKSFKSIEKNKKGRKWTEINEVSILDVKILNVGPDNYFIINSDDISTILKGLGLYQKLDDGKFNMLCTKRANYTNDPKDTSGNLKCIFDMRQFALTEDSFVFKLVSYTSLPGLIKKTFFMDDNFEFSHLIGEFLFKDDMVQLVSIDADGLHFDFNLIGSIDLTKRYVKLSGRLVPAIFFINTIVKHIPILRELIYGKGSGILFAPIRQNFNY